MFAIDSDTTRTRCRMPHGSALFRARNTAFALIVVAFLTPQAIAEGTPKSMLYLEPEPDTSDLVTLPASQRPVDQGDRCIQLMQEAEALKGKPQRRSAAMARYEAECQR